MGIALEAAEEHERGPAPVLMLAAGQGSQSEDDSDSDGDLSRELDLLDFYDGECGLPASYIPVAPGSDACAGTDVASRGACTTSASSLGWRLFRPNSQGSAAAHGKALQPPEHNVQVRWLPSVLCPLVQPPCRKLLR